jgi:hypothetical protein
VSPAVRRTPNGIEVTFTDLSALHGDYGGFTVALSEDTARFLAADLLVLADDDPVEVCYECEALIVGVPFRDPDEPVGYDWWPQTRAWCNADCHQTSAEAYWTAVWSA